jgi:hypothetical protein
MRARIAVSPLGTLQARREGDAVQQLRIGSSWDQIMTTGPKRTLNATCGLSVNITLGAEFSPVKAGTWGFADPSTSQQAMPSLGAQVDQADVVGEDPKENPGLLWSFGSLHIGEP